MKTIVLCRKCLYILGKVTIIFLVSVLIQKSFGGEFTDREIDWKLFQAVQYDYDVEPLLKEGANPDAKVTVNVNSLFPGETPFILALKRSKPKTIDMLIKFRKSNEKIPDEFQLDLFSVAMNTHQKSNPNYWQERMALLLKYGLNLNTIVLEPKRTWRQAHDDKTPLMYAAELGKVEIVKFILENGADVNIKDKKGMTALGHSKNAEIAKLLIAKGAAADSGNLDEKQGLFEAILDGRADVIKELLKSKKYPKEILNDALIRACRVPIQTTNKKAHEASSWIVEGILKAGADPNYQPAKEAARGAPLLEAVYASNTLAVKLLLAAGADPQRAQNSNGGSLIGLSIQQTDPQIVKMLWSYYQPVSENLRAELIKIAGSYGKSESIQMLTSLGFKMSQSKESIEALYRAVEREDIKTVDILLQQGLDLNQKVFGSQNILARAIHTGKIELVSKLVAKGANINVSPENSYSETPLRVAVSNADLEVFRFLVRNGAKIKSEKPEYSLLHSVAWLKGYYGKGSEHDHIKNILDIVSELVKADSRIDAPDEQGESVLIKISSQGYSELVQKLIVLGADVNFLPEKCKKVEPSKNPVEAIAKKGDAEAADKQSSNRVVFSPDARWTWLCNSALQRAVYGNNLENIKVLISAKAKVNFASPYNGMTALMAAAINGNPQIVSTLLESGADPKLKNFAGQTASEIAKIKENTRAQALLEKKIK